MDQDVSGFASVRQGGKILIARFEANEIPFSCRDGEGVAPQNARLLFGRNSHAKAVERY
jgi:hypothetical protein